VSQECEQVEEKIAAELRLTGEATQVIAAMANTMPVNRALVTLCAMCGVGLVAVWRRRQV
jgi:hypothetical protein